MAIKCVAQQLCGEGGRGEVADVCQRE